MKLFRSIAAILGGILFVIVLSTVTDLVLEKLQVYPSSTLARYAKWMLLLAFCYRCLYAIVAGYITAILAPKRRMWHVMVVGYIGLAASTVSAILNWDKPDQWYPIALAITALPSVWLGGKLRKVVKSRRRIRQQ
ncbi:MAG: hypothetical protein V4619_08875 [Bacteroidota bacterium]